MESKLTICTLLNSSLQNQVSYYYYKEYTANTFKVSQNNSIALFNTTSKELELLSLSLQKATGIKLPASKTPNHDPILFRHSSDSKNLLWMHSYPDLLVVELISFQPKENIKLFWKPTCVQIAIDKQHRPLSAASNTEATKIIGLSTVPDSALAFRDVGAIFNMLDEDVQDTQILHIHTKTKRSDFVVKTALPYWHSISCIESSRSGDEVLISGFEINEKALGKKAPIVNVYTFDNNLSILRSFPLHPQGGIEGIFRMRRFEGNNNLAIAMDGHLVLLDVKENKLWKLMGLHPELIQDFAIWKDTIVSKGQHSGEYKMIKFEEGMSPLFSIDATTAQSTILTPQANITPQVEQGESLTLQKASSPQKESSPSKIEDNPFKPKPSEQQPINSSPQQSAVSRVQHQIIHPPATAPTQPPAPTYKLTAPSFQMPATQQSSKEPIIPTPTHQPQIKITPAQLEQPQSQQQIKRQGPPLAQPQQNPQAVVQQQPQTTSQVPTVVSLPKQPVFAITPNQKTQINFNLSSQQQASTPSLSNSINDVQVQPPRVAQSNGVLPSPQIVTNIVQMHPHFSLQSPPRSPSSSHRTPPPPNPLQQSLQFKYPPSPQHSPKSSPKKHTDNIDEYNGLGYLHGYSKFTVTMVPLGDILSQTERETLGLQGVDLAQGVHRLASSKNITKFYACTPSEIIVLEGVLQYVANRSPINYKIIKREVYSIKSTPSNHLCLHESGTNDFVVLDVKGKEVARFTSSHKFNFCRL